MIARRFVENPMKCPGTKPNFPSSTAGAVPLPPEGEGAERSEADEVRSALAAPRVLRHAVGADIIRPCLLYRNGQQGSNYPSQLGGINLCNTQTNINSI